LYFDGSSVPPFLSLSGWGVHGFVPACTLATVHFMDDGGVQTVSTNLSGTRLASAMRLNPCTTGICLAQFASWFASSA
jgi:hypothetical protein